MARSFCGDIQCSHFNLNVAFTMKLAVRNHVLNNDEHHCDPYEKEMKWLLGQNIEILLLAMQIECQHPKYLLKVVKRYSLIENS